MSQRLFGRGRPARHLPLSLIMALSMSAMTACSGDEQADKDAKSAQAKGPTEQRARHGNLPREGYTVSTQDLKGDGRPDVWRYSDPKAGLVRTELDLNFDGRVDVWQYHDKDGQVIEEEMDLDMDGKIDSVIFYTPEGVVTRKELALDFTGKFTVFKYYDGAGELLRVEHDEDDNGTIDRWDFYENKRRVRIGWDENQDGVPDKFDDL